MNGQRGERGERIVVVGASLAGLAAATELRRLGHTGALTVIGDEKYLPYDRPPLSKVIPAGRQGAARTQLPIPDDLDIAWRIGVAATGLDRANRAVLLADGTSEPFDRVLIATGTRARAWPNEREAALSGVLSVRTRHEAEELSSRLRAGVRRVVVVGAGFIGSEVASACRDLGVPVTVVDHGSQPLSNALGSAVGVVAAALQRTAGVDLRLETGVAGILDDGAGGVAAVRLDDGDTLDADVVVVALGSRRNVEWLAGAGLVADAAGVTCDASLRAFGADAVVEDRIWAAGDIVRWPHPVFDNRLVIVEHWGNAVDQARHAAREMLDAATPGRRARAFTVVPRFWSNQFGTNIKSLGIPRFADRIQVVQGSLETERCVLAYGQQGRMVGVVAINAPRELESWELLVRERAPFPPVVGNRDWAGGPRPEPMPARFPGASDHEASADVVGPPMVDPYAAIGFPQRPPS